MVGIHDSDQASAWVKQYCDGDVAAGTSLGAYIRDVLARRFRGMGMPPQDIPDLVQDCTVAVLQEISRFDPEKGSFEGWITGFARNTARAWWRAMYSAKATLVDYDSVPLVEDRRNEPELSASGDLEEALSVLNPIDQELLQMRFGSGMSFDEIADSANITSANARKRVSRAVETLRRQPALRQYFNLS